MNPQVKNDAPKSLGDSAVAAVCLPSLPTSLDCAYQSVAAAATDPLLMAAETLNKLTGVGAQQLASRLAEDSVAISAGTLTVVEGRLAAQAATLDSLFHTLTQFAFKEPRTPEEFSIYLKLALRAQSQSASALASLAEIKQGPRVVVAKQLNAAHQQIVNNGGGDCTAIGKASKPRRPPPLPRAELSTTPDHAQMDPRIARAAAATNPELESVEKIHRTAQ